MAAKTLPVYSKSSYTGDIRGDLMTKVAIALALALISSVASFAQPKSTGPPSPQQKVVLSYFHDVLDGRDRASRKSLPRRLCHQPTEGTVRDLAGIRGVVEGTSRPTRSSRLTCMTSSNPVTVWWCASRTEQQEQACFGPESGITT